MKICKKSSSTLYFYDYVGLIETLSKFPPKKCLFPYPNPTQYNDAQFNVIQHDDNQHGNKNAALNTQHNNT